MPAPAPPPSAGALALAASAAIDTPLLAAPARDRDTARLPLARVGKEVRVVERGDWPESTPTLCWHCCHPFGGPPLPLPIKYDARRDVFHVTGTFCSWGCMKAYNLDSKSYMRHVNATLVTLFKKRCTGRLEGIRPAPPRLALKAFGGTMTIDEFRTCEAEMMILPPKMIMHRPVVEEVPARLRERPSHQDLQDNVSFKDATAQNNVLKLRRPKPLVTHNLLERTMGVQILQPPAAA